ncbi:glycosyltransferase [Geodermatophilus sp. DSM 45219]|uniref:glycosyltransferase n=1 Tax=Geodermatophilus sp. DSM 45219 TaxID=1881103 RepID=UPI000882BE40|nr:glycosyltransferase [Geodermatophilus sp. DSM 45219]SDN80127.1 Glycosyltransferase involved in cell wall bisynthesis [Geodermatophilus sp. DSM 45219]
MSRLSLVCDSENWGGAEVYLGHLLRRAGGLGWTASLVCAEPVAGRFAALVPPGRLAAVPLARHTGAAPAVRAGLAAQEPDVVLVNLVDPGSNAAAVAAALEVAPTVGVLHLPGDVGTGEGRAHLAGLYGAMAAVLTPAAGARGQLVEELGVPGGRVHVVPNGVDVPADPAGPAGNAVPRIGALGRLTAQKGFDVLLDAVRTLTGDGVPVEVVVGGEGRDGERLRAAAAGLPVTFRGFVDDVRGFLAGLDVFCLSSRREALPLVLLEAMAEGLPCVATDVGDVAVAVGADAVVVPPEDAGALAAALAGLVGDPSARARLGRRARERAVASFDADLMARRTSAVLARAAGVPPTGAGNGPGDES